MKNSFFRFLALIIVCFAAFSFQSCKDNKDDKYTVWTDTGTYAEFQQAFQADLQDGYYVRIEITNDEWKEIAKNLDNEGKHRWDEETIKKWLISNGFGESEARKESSWFAVVDHGLLATRTGKLVYLILK